MASQLSGNTLATPSSEGTRAKPRRRTVDRYLVALIVAVGTVIEWLRLPASTTGTLWAEDARNFLGNAVSMGPIRPLFMPYTGYLHTVPRLIADATVQFVPLNLWSVSMALGSCAVVGVVAATVFVCSRDVVQWMPARLLLAAITLLVPLAPREVLGNTANLHWYFLWLAPWLIAYRPRTSRASIVVSVIALLAALTEIQLAFFLPLMLHRLRDRRRWLVRGAYLLGVLCQLVATVLHPRGHPAHALIGIPSVVYGYLINATMTVWNPASSAIGETLRSVGPPAAVAAALPFVGLAVIATRFGSRTERRATVLLSCASVLLWVAAVEDDPGSRYEYSTFSGVQLDHLWLSRYAVVPSMMLLAILPLALSAVRRRLARRALDGTPAQSAVRFIPVSTAVLAVVLLSFHFTPTMTLRSNGPSWQTQVAASQEACEHAPRQSYVALAGAPSANWHLDVTCAQLEQNDS